MGTVQRPDEAAVGELDPGPAGRPADQGTLVFASFLMLFVELALIRWTGANNVYLADATNLVLLASFLGIGLGFLNAKTSRFDFLNWTPLTLLALVAFVLAFPVILLSVGGPDPYRGLHGMPALPRPISLGVIFLLSVAVMAGFGQAVGRLFVRFRPLVAYRLDVAGSIAGIAVFTLLSFLGLPPMAWGLIAAGGLVFLLARQSTLPDSLLRPLRVPSSGPPSSRWWQWAAIAGVVALLVMDSFAPHEQWSPYYKLSVTHPAHATSPVAVSANNVPYQAARPVSLLRKQTNNVYFDPYQHVNRASLANVLIIGAGTGNDVAVALSEGARHIDAVEIDPSLLKIGEQLHPDHPYRSSRVTAHVADGREFLQDTTRHYNLILFALPDSPLGVAGQPNLRLEGYLLTVQSLMAARARLAPGGTFSMYNYYQPFLLARYATSIKQAFGRAPCAQVGPLLSSGRQLADLTVRADGPVPGCTTPWRGPAIAPATDDHPFPYLRTASVPALYLWMLGAILLASLLLVRVAGGRLTRMRGYTDLAFMGAAFLLLETKNIIQFSLLFGSTWLVNALVFAAVLATVYLAVETAGRVRLPPPMVLYAALLGALVLAWVVPQESLLSLAPGPRFLASGALAFAPVYLANLVFAQRFRDVATAETAFAANLLGAIAGGALEYLSLVTGYRFLLVVVGVLYALAFATNRILGRAQPAVR